MESWRHLTKQWERIRWARMNRTSFPRMKDAAESLGIKPGTYRTYEHAPGEDGGRLPELSVLQQIARKYKVSWVWLSNGEGTPDDKAQDPQLQVIGQRLNLLPPEEQDRAVSAILGMLDGLTHKAS